MSLYVDDVRHPFKRMICCHMWADHVDELHAAAAKLGLRREWFQCPPAASWEHYDVSLSVKARALAMGAILTDRYGPLWHLARLDTLSNDPERLLFGLRRLQMVAELRKNRD